jgi:hypothetical protein
MKYQKTFVFDAAHCPNRKDAFWKNVESIVSAIWSEAVITEEEIRHLDRKVKAIKVVIKAKTISHLCKGCYELGCLVEPHNPNRKFLFLEADTHIVYPEDEKINTQYVR